MSFQNAERVNVMTQCCDFALQRLLLPVICFYFSPALPCQIRFLFRQCQLPAEES
ncbi:hypothetical protein BJM06_03709 [Enterobacter cloacae]|nr:hypothetical protein BJM06_03709 [Enterobacter cloacae]